MQKRAGTLKKNIVDGSNSTQLSHRIDISTVVPSTLFYPNTAFLLTFWSEIAMLLLFDPNTIVLLTFWSEIAKLLLFQPNTAVLLTFWCDHSSAVKLLVVTTWIYSSHLWLLQNRPYWPSTWFIWKYQSVNDKGTSTKEIRQRLFYKENSTKKIQRRKFDKGNSIKEIQQRKFDKEWHQM